MADKDLNERVGSGRRRAHEGVLDGNDGVIYSLDCSAVFGEKVLCCGHWAEAGILGRKYGMGDFGLVEQRFKRS